MKRKCFVLLATFVALLVGGRVSSAQAPGMVAVYNQPAMVSPNGLVAPIGFNDACGAPGCSAPGCGAPGCGAGGCNGACGGTCEECCCEDMIGGGYSNRWSVFGEYLYLRARDTEVAWGNPINGAIVPPPNVPIQVGRTGTADMDYQPGYRVGFAYNPNCCTSLSAAYTNWSAGTRDQLAAGAAAGGAGTVLNSLVSHPGVLNVGANYTAGVAQYNMSINMVDVEMHSLLLYDADFQFGYVSGIRWAQHEQTFRADFGGIGTETVTTDLDFSGIGVKTGLEGEKWIGRQLSVHMKGTASLLPGEFNTSYRMNQNAAIAPVVSTDWKAGRIVPIVDFEMGFSWTNQCNTWKVSAGYLYSAWFNSVQTDEWIQAVRTNNFVGLSDTMTFDGLVAKVEARF